MHRLILAAAFLAAACHTETGNPPQPSLTDRGRVISTVIAIDWLADIEQVAKACGRTDPALHAVTYACAQVTLAPDGITSTCTIFAVAPKDFDDTPKLASLGHEFWHCTGAKHA